jgi:Ca2+/Na+ antiporter
MGYIIMGFSIIFINALYTLHIRTTRQQYISDFKKNIDHQIDADDSLPPFIGLHTEHDVVLYHCYGMALIFEGIMSSVYHICPSRDHLQYDSTFMFVCGLISVLLWVHKQKRYRKEHKESHQVLDTAFFLISGIVLVYVLGMNKLRPFIFYLMMAIMSILTVYFLSWFKYFANDYDIMKSCFQVQYHKKNLFTCKFGYLGFVPITIFWIIIVGGYRVEVELTDLALTLMILTNLFYIIYYFLQKNYRSTIINGHISHPADKEEENSHAFEACCSPTSIGMMLAFLIMVGVAFIFYTDASSDKCLSPSDSRALNKDCMAFGFFDNHDIWHFASAFFMLLNGLVPMFIDMERERLLRPLYHLEEEARVG